MKLSVSLPDDELRFVDEYARSHGVPSRSRVLQEALELLRERELGASYQAAWDEWSGEADAWEPTVADGLDGR